MPDLAQSVLGTRSILGTEGLEAAAARKILDTAFFFKNHWREFAYRDSPVAGKTVVLFFMENSTRTR
ncbi:hypothetical protein K2X33_13745, partial [bacterium]|nr:hypothetical protein [bacterium]